MLTKDLCIAMINWPITLCWGNPYASLLLMDILCLKGDDRSKNFLMTKSQLQQITRRLLYAYPSAVLDETLQFLCEIHILEPKKEGHHFLFCEDILLRHIRECIEDAEYSEKFFQETGNEDSIA